SPAPSHTPRTYTNDAQSDRFRCRISAHAARVPAGRVVTPGRPPPNAAEEPIVFVVDDDESVRAALSNLFRSDGLRVEVFGSAADLLLSKLPDVVSCLVLDVRLPGLSGLDFQAELTKANLHIPIIFMTGHGDVPMSVKAMKAGALDFLTKPFR